MAKKNLFDSLFEEPKTLTTDTAETVTETVQPAAATVPNSFPTTTSSTYRIAFIIDHPTEDDARFGTLLSGTYGYKFDSILSHLGISRSSVFIGAVSNRVQNEWTKKQIRFDASSESAQRLRADLDKFQPNICVLLGSNGLQLANGATDLDSWRGSLFRATDSFPTFAGFKCIASFNLKRCTTFFLNGTLLGFDIKKALAESKTPHLNLPERRLIIDDNFQQLEQRLSTLLLTKQKISCDIEGGVRSITCIGIATAPDQAFIVPFTHHDGTSFWTVDEECRLWSLVSQILYDPLIPKIWQNGLYDRFVLQHAMSIVVQGSTDDTMLKHWELYCEMEKGLGFLCSIYTREPFYKADRKTTDEATYYRYCCRDAAVTFEISKELDRFLTPEQKAHYKFNNDSLDLLLYMELHGIKYNDELAQFRLEAMKENVLALQEKLDSVARDKNALAGIDYTVSNPQILTQIQAICGYKKDPSQPKKDFIERGYYDAIQPLQVETTLSPSDRARISALTKTTMNTKSPMFKDFLYETCGFPKQYKKDHATKEMVVTTNYESLLRLSKSHPDPLLHLCLDLSRLRTRQQMLAIRSYQGRMFCSYNLVGSETGRVTSSKSMLYVQGKNRVGGNMQTIPDDWDMDDADHPLTQGMRDLFVADDGCYLFKADLKGADGWTIGAFMKMLGDSTMLDDLLFGIKPAQVVAYILRNGADSYLKLSHDQPQLIHALKEIKKEMWEYFVSKVGIWGYFYTMGPRALANNVFIQSEGKVNLSEKDAKDFQSCIGVRYKANQLHRYFQQQIDKASYPYRLATPNGGIRRFFGRKKEILGEVLAHVPQVVTTYATILAGSRLWNDPENRTPFGSLIIKPLHQVHDELLMQASITDTDFAKRKIKEWFDNKIVVAGQTINIPYSGSYGTAWSMCESHLKGEL